VSSGGPGSGKGTQSLKIAERYGFQYVSVGELLRKKMIHNATSNRKWSLIAKIITNGELAPQETTITEIKQKIMKIPEASGIVIDGFPRDVGQALSFEDQICTPDLVVFLACTNHHLKERLQKRAEQQGRPDDNPKAIDRRLTNFKQNTIPLVKYFQERGLIVTLDADRDEEEVFCDISQTLDNKLFASSEPAAGPSELDLSLLGESSSSIDMGCKYDQVRKYHNKLRSCYCTEQKKPKVVFLMGGPGSGKSLHSERLEERFGVRRLNVGDLLCNELQSHSTRGRRLRDVLERGEPLPQDCLVELLCEAVASSVRMGRSLVISGFPRDVRQAQSYADKMGEPSLVLLLSCSPETMCQRGLRCGTSCTGMDPDTERERERRSDQFIKESRAVTQHYEDKSLLHTMDAERSPDEVFAQICQALESVF
ncbi:hypothetical protein NQD34_013031, partial [Periophthalmus magnuspinnatus]